MGCKVRPDLPCIGTNTEVGFRVENIRHAGIAGSVSGFPSNRRMVFRLALGNFSLLNRSTQELLPGGLRFIARRFTKPLSDAVRELDQGELEATYADAWAIGGSEENDCVCRGGRCPRMWDCPFWVARRRKEAKGSCAHVSRMKGIIIHFVQLLSFPIRASITPNSGQHGGVASSGISTALVPSGLLLR